MHQNFVQTSFIKEMSFFQITGEKILHSSSDLQHTSSCIFPYDKEEFPWHPGTVKRTKQRLESSTTRQLSSDSATSSCASLVKTPSSETLLFNFAEAINDTLIDRTKTTNAEITTNSAISEKIDIPSVSESKNSRLSFSAPEPSSLDLVTQGCALSRSTSNVSEQTKTSVKRQKSCLENWQKETLNSKKTEEGLETSSLGKVQNLKKEFEAKSSITCLEQTVPEPLHDNAQKTTKNRSLPSSPVCVHQTKENPKVGDDLNFDNIRSVFESKKEDGQVVRMRQKYPKPNRNNSRYSCFEVSVDKNSSRVGGTPLISNINKPEENEQLKRPPKVPAVQQIAATVIATAAKKKQQQFGKTHPLARINIKPRHNNPVYNTM